jgi:mRNA interferase RelE/StbE
MSFSKRSGGNWRIALSKNAAVAYKRVDFEIANRLNTLFDILSVDPLPKGAKPVKSMHGVYRYRIGDFRVLYSLNKVENIVEILAIVKRSEAYRKK